ncbi:flagellar hook-basal body complex protein FliE [Caballeronia sp. dw_19]|jgi:flagellar hook-basal body complex protein FliE|uniref:flagellar hook-basal body complex protein FliE n=1 Tax=unclassified Caballeronia TaxID=2646786 RepID=UPI001BCA91D3|nr:flagellar hook-basal body complex protein FliE [Caballeronia sp. dw_19]
MKIDLSIPSIDAVDTKPSDAAGDDLTGTEAGFAHTMKSAFEHADGQQHAAQQKAAAVDSGQSDDLIGAMLASQQASLSFSMLIQVRNKLMGAFDDVIKMPI